jgi:uncharacterized protein Smg (DUF494 family)
MEEEINESIIQYLRENYQVKDSIGEDPITSSEIAEELRDAGFGSLEVYSINKYLKRTGFKSIPIPGDADSFWLIKAQKI